MGWVGSFFGEEKKIIKRDRKGQNSKGDCRHGKKDTELEKTELRTKRGFVCRKIREKTNSDRGREM